jgi:hypothetical protein
VLKSDIIDSMSHVGNYHVKHGMPCQDRVVATIRENIILAVADGMGSYEHAELGAEFAVKYIEENGYQLMKHIHRLEEGDEGVKDFSITISTFMFRLAKSMINYAFNIGESPDELHTTLSFSLIGPKHFLNVSIGDSPIYTMMKSKSLYLDGNNVQDRKNVNITYSVVDMDTSIHHIGIQVGLTEDLVGVLITSDGALGMNKQNPEIDESVPDWFKDLIVKYQDHTDLELAVNKLIETGYDDVGVACYVNAGNLESTISKIKTSKILETIDPGFF